MSVSSPTPISASSSTSNTAASPPSPSSTTSSPPPALPSSYHLSDAESVAASTPHRLSVISYNVNSLRTLVRRLQLPSFAAFLDLLSPSILCLQETKVSSFADLPPDLLHPPGYDSFFSFDTVNKGRNGVVTYALHGLTATAREGLPPPPSPSPSPPSSSSSFSPPPTAAHWTAEEGRLLVTDHTAFVLVNAYFPNGGRGDDRVAYKMRFYAEVEDAVRRWREEGREVLVVGDVNTAHQPIDIHNPKIKTTGFLPIERAWLDRILSTPPSPPSSPSSPSLSPSPSSSPPSSPPLLIDSWRAFHPSLQQFSFWDMKTLARGRNKGWRIDYALATPELYGRELHCAMHPEMTASDHSPVVVYMEGGVMEEARRGGGGGVRVLGVNQAVEGTKWVAKVGEKEAKKGKGQKSISSFFASKAAASTDSAEEKEGEGDGEEKGGGEEAEAAVASKPKKRAAAGNGSGSNKRSKR